MLKYSRQRESIKNFLIGRYDHPTAETIYKNMKMEYPNISLGTVYRNLNHLCQRGLIRRVGTVDGQERYDGVITPHSHFICDRCGAILDLSEHSPGRDWLEAVGVQYGFQAEGCEFIVRGVCRDCVGAQAEADP